MPAFDYCAHRDRADGPLPAPARVRDRGTGRFGGGRGRARRRPERRAPGDRAFRTLSGGEKQRVVIASALAQLGSSPWTRRHAGPTAGADSLLDEPTASLDLAISSSVASLPAEPARRGDVLLTLDIRFASAATVCNALVAAGAGACSPTARPRRADAGPCRRLYDVDPECRGRASPGHRMRLAGLSGRLPVTSRVCPFAAGCARSHGFSCWPWSRCRRRSSVRHRSRFRPRVRFAPLPFAENVDAQISSSRRLPRAFAAALVGGTLAAAGVVFQGLLRNPLATPYTLGVSAGAPSAR